MNFRFLLSLCFLASFSFHIVQGIENTWQVPGIIPDSNLNARIPVVAMDGAGNAIALWQDPGTSTPPNDYKVCRYSATTQSWGSIKTIGQTFSVSRQANLAVDSAGNAIIAWREEQIPGGGYYIKAIYYNASQDWETWDPDIKIIYLPSSPVPSAPTVAISDSGTAIIVYDYSVEGVSKTRATQYDRMQQSWSSWDPNTYLKINFPDGFDGIIVAMDAVGSAVFCYKNQTTSVLYATRYDRLAETSWNAWNPATDNKLIYSGTSGVFLFGLDMNSRGDAVLNWNDNVSAGLVITTLFEISQTWASWTPVIKTLDTSTSARGGGGAIDDAGNVIFVWYKYPSMYAVRYDGSGWATWDPPTPIVISLDRIVGTTLDFKKVVVDKNGNGIVSYVLMPAPGDDKAMLQMALYDVAQGWREPVNIRLVDTYPNPPSPTILKNNPNPTLMTAMVIAAHSTEGIVWSVHLDVLPTKLGAIQPYGDESETVAAISDADGNLTAFTFGSPAVAVKHAVGDPNDVWTTEVISNPDQIVTEIALAGNDPGDGLYGYVDESVTGSASFWTKYNSGAPEQISTPTHNAQDISVAVSDSSNAAGVYVNNNVVVRSGCQTTGPIFASLYNAMDQTWNLEEVTSDTGTCPQVDIDGIGNVTVVWRINDNGTLKVQARRAEFSTTLNTWDWKSIVDLTDGSNDADQPQVGMSSIGNTVFAWKESDGQNFRITATWFSTYDDWDSWVPAGSAQTLSAAEKEADNLRLTVDGAGNALVVYEIEDDNDNIRIQAARFDALTRSWAVPSSRFKDLPQYLSPAGVDASLPNANIGTQGNGLAAYRVGDATFTNFYNATTQSFSQPIELEFPVGVQGTPAPVASFNGSVQTVFNTVNAQQTKFRQIGTNELWVSLSGPGPGPQPNPPTNVTSSRNNHRFATQSDIFDKICWQPGDDTAVSYELYADPDRTELICKKGTKEPLCFCIHGKWCIKNTYYLFAVNAEGTYSSPVNIVAQ